MKFKHIFDFGKVTPERGRGLSADWGKALRSAGRPLPNNVTIVTKKSNVTEKNQRKPLATLLTKPEVDWLQVT